MMFHCVDKRGKKILFNTGSLGVKGLLLEKLRAVKCDSEDVDMVIISHCHCDHMVNCRLFPRAKYVVPKKEWNYVFSPQSRGDVHLGKEMAGGLSQSGRLNVLEKEDEIKEGVKVLFAPDHTPGLIAILADTPMVNIYWPLMR